MLYVTPKAWQRPRQERRSITPARLIEQAEALGEPAEDPLLLYSVLYGFFIAEVYRLQRRCCMRACDGNSLRSRSSRKRRPLS